MRTTLVGLALLCAFASVSFAQVKMNAYPLMINAVEPITVSWTGVDNYSPIDIIAAYLLNDNGATVISITNTSASQSHNAANGTGQIIFPLQNFRQPFVFKYIRNDTVLGTSNLVQGNTTIPQHGHLALTGVSGEMRVMWNSGSNASTPVVRYGSSATSLTMSATGSSSTFTVEDTCFKDSPLPKQWIDPGYQHDVVLSGLSPSTTYFYQYGNADECWSDVFNFTSAALVGDTTQPTLFVATADTGTYMCENLTQNVAVCELNSHATFDGIQASLAKQPAGLLLHVGDLAYAIGYEWTWDQFMSTIEPISTSLAYMVGIGNHEYDYLSQPFRPIWSNYFDDANGECGVPYSQRFHMPDVEDSPLRGLWYSFDYGLGHFVFMSSEHNWTIGSPQWNWLVNDLASVNRSITPWVIFSGHRPMYYTDFQPDPNLIMAYFLRKHLEPVLLKYGVDLALWGHVHVYERTCMLQHSTCVTQGGVVHVVIGNGGREVAPMNYDYVPYWSIYREKAYGFARVALTPTTLTFQYFGNNDTLVHDSFVITK